MSVAASTAERDSHLLERLDGGLAIIEFFAPNSMHRSELAKAGAMKQLDDGIGNTLVSVCIRPKQTLPSG
jgi:hypothetical protein